MWRRLCCAAEQSLASLTTSIISTLQRGRRKILMRFAGRENKRVASFNRRCSILVPDNTLARNDVVKFPLRAVQMIGVRTFSWRDAADLDIKWVPLFQVRRLWLASQLLRDLFARPDKLSFRRRPGQLLNLVCINLAHLLTDSFSHRVHDEHEGLQLDVFNPNVVGPLWPSCEFFF